jgi:hypothetical protein
LNTIKSSGLGLLHTTFTLGAILESNVATGDDEGPSTIRSRSRAKYLFLPSTWHVVPISWQHKQGKIVTQSVRLELGARCHTCRILGRELLGGSGPSMEFFVPHFRLSNHFAL